MPAFISSFAEWQIQAFFRSIKAKQTRKITNFHYQSRFFSTTTIRPTALQNNVQPWASTLRATTVYTLLDKRPRLLSSTLCVNQTRKPSSGLHSARWSLHSSGRWSLPSRPHAPRPQCAVNWDRNLKPKLAIMRQCTSVTDRRTDRRTLTS